MQIVFYISGHGLGHASRDIEVITEILARRGDTRIVVRTDAPRWLFDTAGPQRIELAPLQADTGVAQIDSLHVDEEDTARRAAEFYRRFEVREKEEASWLRKVGATTVVGDIPPLAFAAAARAGVRSIAIGNFTWDWIYRGYPGFETAAPGVIDRIRDAYSGATRALRLPMHGGFEPMAAVTRDIPLVARTSTKDPIAVRQLLGVPDDRPFVVASFAGHGAPLDYREIARSQHLTIVAPAREAPCGLRYPDLVAAADVVVSKPGYGIISECVANGAALLYTSRGHFIEYDVLVTEMPRLLRCRYIPQEDLLAGRWASAIHALLDQPHSAGRVRVDGAEIAAEEILNG